MVCGSVQGFKWVRDVVSKLKDLAVPSALDSKLGKLIGESLIQFGKYSFLKKKKKFFHQNLNNMFHCIVSTRV